MQELILPFFDKILSGFTALRLLELAPKLVERGLLKDIRTGNLTVEEDIGVVEMMYVGSTLPILPIISWDEEPLPIGDGSVGELTMAGPLGFALGRYGFWSRIAKAPSSLRVRIRFFFGD